MLIVEPYQGDLFELPIYGESSKQEKSCTSRLDPAVVKSSNEKLSKPSKSSDTKYSYSLKVWSNIVTTTSVNIQDGFLTVHTLIRR